MALRYNHYDEKSLDGSYRDNILNALSIFPDDPDLESEHFGFSTYSNQLYKLLRDEDPHNRAFAICLDGE